MNAESIGTWLTAVGVPAEIVSIGTEADNTWCLLRDEQPADTQNPGTQNPGTQDPGAEPSGDTEVTWEVFWREQGNRYDWARFTNEQVACHYLFGRLVFAQVARGAVGVLPEPRAPQPQPQPQARSAP